MINCEEQSQEGCRRDTKHYPQGWPHKATVARQAATDDVSPVRGRSGRGAQQALGGARARAGSEHLAGVEDVLGTAARPDQDRLGWESYRRRLQLETARWKRSSIASPEADARKLDHCTRPTSTICRARPCVRSTARQCASNPTLFGCLGAQPRPQNAKHDKVPSW